MCDITEMTRVKFEILAVRHILGHMEQQLGAVTSTGASSIVGRELSPSIPLCTLIMLNLNLRAVPMKLLQAEKGSIISFSVCPAVYLLAIGYLATVY